MNSAQATKKRSRNTCEWLSSHSSYTSWKTEQYRLLWIQGKPGSGKSTLLNYAVQSLRRRLPGKRMHTVSFFFNGRGVPLEQKPEGLYRSLLHQLMKFHQPLANKMTKIFQERQDDRGEYPDAWTWGEELLKDCLEYAFENVPDDVHIDLFVDALDEAGEKSARAISHYLDDLAGDAMENNTSLNICFSCRHYPVLHLPHAAAICMEEVNGADISHYVCAELGRSGRSETLKENLQEYIIGAATGVFQWAALVVMKALDLCCQSAPANQILESIKDLPKELDALYERLLAGISMHNYPSTVRLFQWLCFCVEPLNVDNLLTATCLDSEHMSGHSRDIEGLEIVSESEYVKVNRVKHLSRGLAEIVEIGVSKSDSIRKEVRLVHQSVREYLMPKGITAMTQPNFSSNGDLLGWNYAMLATCCLNFVALDDLDFLPHYSESWPRVREFIRNTKSNLNVHSFLSFATKSWHRLAKEAEAHNGNLQGLPSLLEIVLKRLYILQRCTLSSPSRAPGLIYGSTPLHVCLESRLCSTVDACLARDISWLRTMDGSGRDPITLVVKGRDTSILQKICQTMLEKEISLNTNVQRRGLDFATEHLPSLEILLQYQSVLQYNLDFSFDNKQVVFSKAIKNGQANIVKLLLQHQVDVNATMIWNNPSDGEMKNLASRSSPYEVAVALGNHECAGLILSSGKLDPCPITLLGAMARSREAYITLLGLFLKKNKEKNAEYWFSLLFTADGSAGSMLIRIGNLFFTNMDANIFFRLLEVLLKAEPDALMSKDFIRGFEEASEEQVMDIAAQAEDKCLLAFLLEEILFEDAPITLQQYRAEQMEPKLANLLSGQSPTFYGAGIAQILQSSLKITTSLTFCRMALFVMREAIRHNRIDIVDYIVQLAGSNSDNVFNLIFEISPQAVKEGRTEILESILPILTDRDPASYGTTYTCNSHNSVLGNVSAGPCTDEHLTNLLNLAAVNGHTDIMNLLMSHSHRTGGQADYINSTNALGETSLHLAAGNRQGKAVALLIETAGVEINALDADEWTPLHTAAFKGHAEIVQILLDALLTNTQTNGHTKGTELFAEDFDFLELDQVPNCQELDVNAASRQGETPLHLAAHGGHSEVVDILIRCEAVDSNASNENDETPLHLAAEHGHSGVADLLIRCEKVDSNASNEDGDTPLHLAAAYGHSGVANILIRCEKVDSNASNENGDTPLHLAAAYGHSGVADLLSSCEKVDVNASGSDGRTPLHLAAKLGHSETVNILTRCEKVDLNAQNVRKETALHLAAISGHLEVVELLAKCKNVELNTKDCNGDTPLHMAAGSCHAEVVDLLIHCSKVNVNAQNDSKDTTLHVAAFNGEHLIAVSLLSKTDIKPDLENAIGQSPRFVAMANGNNSISKLLEDHARAQQIQQG